MNIKGDTKNSCQINLKQEFKSIYHEKDFICKIYRFSIYKMEPSKQLSQDEVDYYVIVDDETGSEEICVLGIRWNKNPPMLHAQTSILVGHGDPETFWYVVDSLVNTIKNQFINQNIKP